MCVHHFRNRELAVEVLEKITPFGIRCGLQQADITKPAEAERLIQETIREFGQIDILANCAGIARDNTIQFLSDIEWDQVINVNLNGPMYTCKAISKHMVSRRTGKIINIASVTGSTGQEMRTNYGASKGALLALTKAIARELGPFGIQVNAIAPQIVEGGLSATAAPQYVKETIQITPIGRLGQGSDIAKAALFLASDLSEYIAGGVLFVTGGLITHQV